MSNKGQRPKQYSDELKEKIVKEYLSGNGSNNSLAEKYGITSGKTVFSWIKQYKENGYIKSKKRGRKSEENLVDYKVRYEILKKYQAFLKEQQKKK